RLLALKPPHLHLLTASAEDTCDFAWSLERTPGHHAVARLIRGSKSRTVSHLFDECAAALQFPHYFGENWDAFNECLGDLEWLHGDAFVLFFADCQRLLDQEPLNELGTLLDVLENVAGEWATRGKGESSRRSHPFHVVFQCSAQEKAAFGARLQGLRRS